MAAKTSEQEENERNATWSEAPSENLEPPLIKMPSRLPSFLHSFRGNFLHSSSSSVFFIFSCRRCINKWFMMVKNSADGARWCIAIWMFVSMGKRRFRFFISCCSSARRFKLIKLQFVSGAGSLSRIDIYRVCGVCESHLGRRTTTVWQLWLIWTDAFLHALPFKSRTAADSRNPKKLIQPPCPTAHAKH